MLWKDGAGCANSDIATAADIGECVSLATSRRESEHISSTGSIAKGGFIIGTGGIKADLAAPSSGASSAVAAGSLAAVSTGCGLGRSEAGIRHQPLTIDGKTNSWLAHGPVVIFTTRKESSSEGIVSWRASTSWAESSCFKAQGTSWRARVILGAGNIDSLLPIGSECKNNQEENDCWFHDIFLNWL